MAMEYVHSGSFRQCGQNQLSEKGKTVQSSLAQWGEKRRNKRSKRELPGPDSKAVTLTTRIWSEKCVPLE